MNVRVVKPSVLQITWLDFLEGNVVKNAATNVKNVDHSEEKAA